MYNKCFSLLWFHPAHIVNSKLHLDPNKLSHLNYPPSRRQGPKFYLVFSQCRRRKGIIYKNLHLLVWWIKNANKSCSLSALFARWNSKPYPREKLGKFHLYSQKQNIIIPVKFLWDSVVIYYGYFVLL